MKTKNYFLASDEFINLSILVIFNFFISCLGTIIGFATQNNHIFLQSISVLTISAVLFSIIIISEKKGLLGKKKKQDLTAFSDVIAAITSVTIILFLFFVGFYYGADALTEAFIIILLIGIVGVSIHSIYLSIKDYKKHTLRISGDHDA